MAVKEENFDRALTVGGEVSGGKHKEYRGKTLTLEEGQTERQKNLASRAMLRMRRPEGAEERWSL